MTILHLKTNTIADFTGTVTVYGSAGGTATVAATDLVRPSDWNSAHQHAYTLTGNTNNSSVVTGTNVFLSGGTNVTLVGSNNSIGFSVGNYITTGALSDHSHGNPQLNLTNISGTTASASDGFTLSLSAADAGGGATLKGYLAAAMDREWLAAQIGNNQCFVQPLNVREAVQFDEVCIFANFSNASNSSNSGTLTLNVGIYTRNNSTLSLVTSASKSFAVTASGTVGSYSIYGGPREYGIPLTTTLPPDNYWIAFLSRTTTGGGAGMTWSNFVASQINSAYSGRFSSANNATNQFYLGLGSYNTTTTAIPGSIGFNQINGSAAVNNRPAIFKLVSQASQLMAEIVGYDYGKHNAELMASTSRVMEGATWKKQRIVVLLPSEAMLPAKVALAHWNIIFPPNQAVYRMLCLGMEVGDAYTQAVEAILAHPDLSQWEYILTLEHDNIPPPDGVLKLIERMEKHPELSCIGGLYWTKGEGGQPQIWGDITDPVVNYRPVPPKVGELVECYGTGMGFNLWRISMFKDKNLRKPWFKTPASIEGVGTQDLYFWNDARKYGYRCAVDCSVLVGHYDKTTGINW